MFVYLLLTWIVCLDSALTDEYQNIVNEGELSAQYENYLRGIVPGNPPFQHSYYTPDKIEMLLKGNKQFNNLVIKASAGKTKKGLTFNIYDDDLRDAAVYLFQLIRDFSVVGYDIKRNINLSNVNTDMLAYIYDLGRIYNERELDSAAFIPLFIRKPNYFINSEAIIKAMLLSNRQNISESDESRINQYYRVGDTVIINSNYSGWNLPQNGGEEELNYFREDISLNSYYYGVNLMHPYWLFGTPMNIVHRRHNEHFYYLHQQLSARFLLEKQHLMQAYNTSKKTEFGDFNPYLIHSNGLPFPVRSNVLGDWSADRAKIKTIDIAIRECMARGIIVMSNTTFHMSEENYVDLLTKLIRANYDGLNTAKIIRSLFGYGGNGYPHDVYNPAPSVLHFPETALRDPIYWYMIEYALNYFTEYKETLSLFIPYETDNFTITHADIPNITTYFDYYQFNISNAIAQDKKMPLTFTVRQKRLTHAKFSLRFTVESKINGQIIVRLYLGPPCENCWEEYSKFFEMDTFQVDVQSGTNNIVWSPETSRKLSNDEFYNLEESSLLKNTTDKYNIFKFPENMLIPRGLEDGMNMTLFVMITPTEEDFVGNIFAPYDFYGHLYNELDAKPFGFPFHRPSNGDKDSYNNYKFYNIQIYHRQNNIDSFGHFSPHLL